MHHSLKNAGDICCVAEDAISAILGVLIVILVIAVITLSVIFARKTMLWYVYFQLH